MTENCNDALIASMMNNNNGWNQNPFIYLIFLALFKNGGFFGNNGEGVTASTLQETINNNHNSDLTMSAINGNANSIKELASNLNCDFNALNIAVSGIRSAIDKVAGEVGFTSEKVINAVLLGNKDLTSAIQSCCCQTQQSILKMGYENQLATANQTSQIQERLTGIANGIQQGFSSVAFESQKQTCDIINAGNANTQRVIDALNGHWNLELSQKLQDTKNELSQERQTAYLISQLKTTASAGA